MKDRYTKDEGDNVPVPESSNGMIPSNPEPKRTKQPQPLRSIGDRASLNSFQLKEWQSQNSGNGTKAAETDTPTSEPNATISLETPRPEFAFGSQNLGYPARVERILEPNEILAAQGENLAVLQDLQAPGAKTRKAKPHSGEVFQS